MVQLEELDDHFVGVVGLALPVGVAEIVEIVEIDDVVLVGVVDSTHNDNCGKLMVCCDKVITTSSPQKSSPPYHTMHLEYFVSNNICQSCKRTPRKSDEK